MNKIIIFITLTFWVLMVKAEQKDFDCSLRVYKNTCWKNYEVKVEIIDINLSGSNVIEKVIIPKNKHKAKIKFPCKNNQYLSFHASFSPTIWQGEEKKRYPTKKLWVVPYTIEDDALEWLVKLRFPKDFQRVPEPPLFLQNCEYLEDDDENDTNTKKENNPKTKGV